MRIEIFEGRYVIKSDRLQYVLYRADSEVNGKNHSALDDEDGNLVFEGSFKYMEDAVRKATEEEARTNRATTMEGYYRHVKKVQRELKASLKGLADTVGADVLFKPLHDLDERQQAADVKMPKKQAAKTTAKPASKSVPKPASKPVAKPASKSDSKAAAKSATKTASKKTAAKAVDKPAAKKSATKPVSKKPANKAAKNK